MRRAAPAFDDDVRHIAVKRVASKVQLLQAPFWIRHLQQRSAAVMTGSLPQNLGRNVQIDNHTPLCEQGTVLGKNNGTTPGGNHKIGLEGERVQGLGFTTAKTVFALDFENYWNLDAGACLDFVVTVDKTPAEALCELSADCGFS